MGSALWKPAQANSPGGHLNTREQRTNTCRPLNPVWLKPKIRHHTGQKQVNTYKSPAYKYNIFKKLFITIT